MSDRAFLGSTLPETSKQKSTRNQTVWRGLKIGSREAGYIVDGQNFIITTEGHLRAADKPVEVLNIGSTPYGLYGIDDELYAVYKSGNTTILERLSDGETVTIINEAGYRSIAKYNVWTGKNDIVNGTYAPKILVYPDKKVVSLTNEQQSAFDVADIQQKEYILRETITTSIRTSVYDYGSYSEEAGSDPPYSFSDNPSYTKMDESDVVHDTIYYSEQERDTAHQGKSDSTVNKQKQYTKNTELERPTLTVTAETVYTKYTDVDITLDTPEATNVAIYNTRVFGVNGSKIFASGTNSYTNYDLDTSSDIDENNAWYSASAEGGDFTAVVTYGGRVTAFKKNLLVELYNSKNPFRIKEISKVGTFNAASVAETASTLFFTSTDGIYAYTGAYPRNISKESIPLNILDDKQFTNGVAGANDGHYIVREDYEYDSGDTYGEDGYDKPCFVYDSYTGVWSVLNFTTDDILSFANKDGHQYALLETGYVYKLDTHDKSDTKWYVETPIECDETAMPKVLEKVQAVLRFHTAGEMTFKVKYDNGQYETIGHIEKESGVHPIYMKIRKGDHVARFLRIEAKGDVEVVTFEQILSAGGDRY